MGPLELNWASGEEPMGLLEQVTPLKQESTGPFGDNGAPEASWGTWNKSQRGPLVTTGTSEASWEP